VSFKRKDPAGRSTLQTAARLVVALLAIGCIAGLAVRAAAAQSDSIAAGFAKLGGAKGESAAPSSGVAEGFAAVTRERDLQARVAVEAGKFRSASPRICQSKMREFEACYARASCGQQAPPPGYSESRCEAIPRRPYVQRPLLTSGDCDRACQDRSAAYWDSQERAIAGDQAQWDAQWSALASQCQAVKAQRAPLAACLQAQRNSCNPRNISQDSCVAERDSRPPSVAEVRAMVAREAGPPPKGATIQTAKAEPTPAEAANAARMKYQRQQEAILRAAMPELPKAPKTTGRRTPAQLKAEQAAQKLAEEEAVRKYLAAVASGTTLKARRCPGGYYLVGLRPKIKPEVVPCIDVLYRAQCAGSNGSSDGIGKNFIGIATDCYMGDTFKVEPTPACPVEDVKVTIRAVTACSMK
jgi:hypothetical protein